MSGKSINFDGKNINKSNFYKNKKIFNIYDLDVNKILVFKKESYDKKKYGYNDDDDVIKPFEQFDSNKTMSFKISDNKLLKKLY